MTREVSAESYTNATPGRAIPVVRDPVLSIVNFGAHAAASFWFVLAVCLIALMCLFLGDSDRPDDKWYLEKMVVDHGSGRLADTKPARAKDASEIRALVDEAFGRKS